MSTTTFPTRSDAVSTATAGKDYLIHVNKGASDLEPDWLLVGGQRSGNLAAGPATCRDCVTGALIWNPWYS